MQSSRVRVFPRVVENIFRFDGILNDSSQDDVYEHLGKPCVLAALSGYNSMRAII